MIVTRPGDGTHDGGISMEPAASAQHTTCRQLHIKRLRIHAQICGAGEPLLLHSGIWADAALWKPLLRSPDADRQPGPRRAGHHLVP
jgi:hypothetical protein